MRREKRREEERESRDILERERERDEKRICLRFSHLSSIIHLACARVCVHYLSSIIHHRSSIIDHPILCHLSSIIDQPSSIIGSSQSSIILCHLSSIIHHLSSIIDDPILCHLRHLLSLNHPSSITYHSATSSVISSIIDQLSSIVHLLSSHPLSITHDPPLTIDIHRPSSDPPSIVHHLSIIHALTHSHIHTHEVVSPSLCLTFNVVKPRVYGEGEVVSMCI